MEQSYPIYACTDTNHARYFIGSGYNLRWLNERVFKVTFEKTYTVEPRLSGPRLSGLFDYPDFFSGPVFFMNINKL